MIVNVMSVISQDDQCYWWMNSEYRKTFNLVRSYQLTNFNHGTVMSIISILVENQILGRVWLV